VRAVREQLEEAQAADREERPPSSRQRDGDSEQADGVEEQPLAEHAADPPRSVASHVVRQIPEFLEESGTQWLQSRIEDGRAALCSEPVRLRVRESTEQVIRPFVVAGLELVPDRATRRALQQDSERTLDALIKDTLEQFCSERVLDDIQHHSERAIHALVRGEIGTTLQEVWAVVRALIRTVVVAVQHQWRHFVHLLLDIILKGMHEMIGRMLKEGFATIVAAPVEEIEEKADAAKENVKHKGEELRERLAERLETLQERIGEEVGKVKERVAEGLKSAVEDGTRSSSIGRPPTGRPPSVRLPSGRPPTGRPPSARPPSGRPPSLTRRSA
jgi:hypothetical protein